MVLNKYKNDVWALPFTYKNINSDIINISLGAMSTKLLGKHLGVNLHDFELGTVFLNMILKI